MLVLDNKFLNKLFQPLRRCLSLLEYESNYKFEDVIFLILGGHSILPQALRVNDLYILSLILLKSV